ncbi:hypothetical protein RB195_007435 [Necator americanus]|uniref:Trimethylguanosine synthase n=1 Tax=Necator americanus TaxID=51031 RepID=A0ABR1C105_NECAM
MEDDITIPEDEFKFPWEHLADFYAIFKRRNEKYGTTYDYECSLSRVHLNDKDLVRISERKQASETTDVVDLTESLEMMGVRENGGDEPSNVLDDISTEKMSQHGEDGLKNIELTRDAWAELPKRFGSSKTENHSRYYKRRKKSHEDAQKWLRNTTFEEYWEEAASYVIYRTWYEDYGNIMNEDDRDQLKKQIEECKPFALIDEHSDEQIHKYFGLTKDAKYSTYEELFAMHSDAIVKLAAKDFELFRAVLTSHRCKTFLKKVEKMGFVPGYADSDINAPNGTHISESEEVVPRKKTKPEGEKRFPVTYGDDEVFSDIYYDVYDPHAASMNIVLDRCDNSSKEGDCVEKADVLVTAQEPTSNSHSSPDDAHIDVSFAFNPDKEPHLVAKNAFQYYRDDQEIIKYWYQRYRLFSKLDNGVIMDREGWFSVTPERIAEHIADRVVRRPEMLVVDAFAGVGGNSIQMAIKGARVIAIDMDPVRLKCARENAKVYGVEDRIEFICCDFFHFASKWTENVGKTVQMDAVFLSPPWGGPSYLKSKVFDLDDLTPNGFDIYTAARKMSPNIAYFLPRSTSVKQLISLSGPGGRCEIEQSCLNKKIKALTIYYGDLAVQRGE